jgi:hypothetical protein
MNTKSSVFIGRQFALACMTAMLLATAAFADDDKLRDLGTNAAPGEIPKWDGNEWRLAHDDITTVIAGAGLTGGGTNKTVTVSVNFAGTGTSNTVARSDHNHPDLEATRPPVGAVISWLKNFANTPTNLPAGWVECNGQILNDAGSVYNGLAIPNLNGSGGGVQRFLRGSTAPGTIGGTESHNHQWAGSGSSLDNGPAGGVDGSTFFSDGTPNDNYNGDQAAFTSRTGTLPSYYEVVWIMRVK